MENQLQPYKSFEPSWSIEEQNVVVGSDMVFGNLLLNVQLVLLRDYNCRINQHRNNNVGYAKGIRKQFRNCWIFSMLTNKSRRMCLSSSEEEAGFSTIPWYSVMVGRSSKDETWIYRHPNMTRMQLQELKR